MILEVLIEQGNCVYDFPITPQSKFIDIIKCFYEDKYGVFTIIENNNGIERRMDLEDNVFKHSLANSNVEGVYYILRNNDNTNVSYGKHEDDNVNILQQLAKQQTLKIQEQRRSIHAKEQRIKFLKQEQLRHSNACTNLSQQPLSAASAAPSVNKKLRTIDQLERKLKIIKQDKNGIKNDMRVALAKDIETDLLMYNKHFNKQLVEYSQAINHIKKLITEIENHSKSFKREDLIHQNNSPDSSDYNSSIYNKKPDWQSIYKPSRIDNYKPTMAPKNIYEYSENRGQNLKVDDDNGLKTKTRTLDPFEMARNLGYKSANLYDKEIDKTNFKPSGINTGSDYSKTYATEVNQSIVYNKFPSRAEDNYKADIIPSQTGMSKFKLYNNMPVESVENIYFNNDKYKNKMVTNARDILFPSYSIAEQKTPKLPLEITAPTITLQPASPLTYQLKEGPKLVPKETSVKESISSPLVKYTRPIAITSPLVRDHPSKINEESTLKTVDTKIILINRPLSIESTNDGKELEKSEEQNSGHENTFIEHSTVLEDNSGFSDIIRSIADNKSKSFPNNSYASSTNTELTSFNSSFNNQNQSKSSSIRLDSFSSSKSDNAADRSLEDQILSPMILDMMDGSFNQQRFSFNEDAPRPLRRKLNLLGHQLSDSYSDGILNHLIKLEDDLVISGISDEAVSFGENETSSLEGVMKNDEEKIERSSDVYEDIDTTLGDENQIEHLPEILTPVEEKKEDEVKSFHNINIDLIIRQNLNKSIFPSIDDSYIECAESLSPQLKPEGASPEDVDSTPEAPLSNHDVAPAFDEVDSLTNQSIDDSQTIDEPKAKPKLVFERAQPAAHDNLVMDYVDFDDEDTNVTKRIQMAYKAAPKGLKSKLKKMGAGRRVEQSVRVQFDPLILLLDAALQGELESVKKSIAQLSNISACNDEGVTALHNAVCGGHLEIVKFLIGLGCDVNAGDGDMWSPLHCAASLNNVSICRELIEGGACPFAIASDDGKTASMKCDLTEDGYQECLSYLREVEERMGSKSQPYVYSVFEYDALREDEVSLRVNEKVKVISKGEEGDGGEIEWWIVQLADGQQGYAPRNYISLYPKASL